MARRKPDNDDLKAREVLASEMVDFRKNNIFTQKRLAEILVLSRRTIQMIEAGLITPHPSTITAFRELVAKYKAASEVSI